MSEIKKVAKYSAVITLILVSTKLVGFLRELLIAVKFGATREADIFKIATTMPQVLFAAVAAAIITSFIPVFAGVKNDKEKANTFFNNILNSVFIICVLLMTVGIVAAPQLTRLFAGGFQGEDFTRTVYMTRILMPSIVFLGISALFTGYLQSYGIFIQPALTDMSASFVIIAGILIFYKYGIMAAVIATVLSSIAQMLVQRPFLRDFKYRFHVDTRDHDARRLLGLAVPTIISTVVNQLNVMVSRNFASRLVAGSISVYDYAYKISTIINQVFIVSITTVLYPSMTEKYASGDMEGFKELIVRALNIVLIVAVPLIFGVAALSTPIVKLLLEHGRFDSRATQLTAMSLGYLAFGALGYSLIDILSKIYYAARNTFVPMIIGFLNVGINIVLIMFLAPRFGVGGLALATTFTVCTISMTMLVILGFKIRGIKFIKVFITFVKASIAGGVMGLSVHFGFDFLRGFTGEGNMGLAAALIVSTAAGAVIYSLFMTAFRVEEFKTVVQMLLRRKKA